MKRTCEAVLSLWLLSGCTAMRMAVPADVAQASEELPILDRSGWSGALTDESFGLGPYKISDVDRDWNSTRSTSMWGNKMSKTTGGYAFKLSGQGQALEGNCATESRERSTKLGSGMSFGSTIAKLGCSCTDGNGGAELVLDSGRTERYEGTLSTSNGEFRVSSVNEREGGGSSFDPTGYRVDGSDAPKGAVDVLGTGRVWVSKTLEGRQRAEVACIFAGLLLYQQPSEH